MKHSPAYFIPLLVLAFAAFFRLAGAQTQGPGYETQRYIVTQIDSQTVSASQPWHNPIGERVNDVKVTIQDITRNRITSTRQESISVAPGEDFTDTLFFPRESGEGSLIFRANMAGVLRPAQVTTSATYDSFSRLTALSL